MIIVGIDIGIANCGWAMCVVNPHTKEITLRKTNGYGVIRTDPEQLMVARIHEVASKLSRIMTIGPEKIYIEEPFFLSKRRSGNDLQRCVGAVQNKLWEIGHYSDFLSASEIKKTFTGNGAANKADIIAEVKSRYGVEIADKDNHAADAIAIAYTGYTLKQKGCG